MCISDPARLSFMCSSHHTTVMEMDVLADTTGGSGMSAAQQQLFFKEASDASYRAKGNLTPDQQVRG